MDSNTATWNLGSHVVHPVRKCLGRRLQGFFYYDIGSEEELFTDGDGVDIIAHQVELNFEEGNTIFISWGTIDGWRQYSLCVSEKSFCIESNVFPTQDEHWAAVMNSRLSGFDIYGYRYSETASSSCSEAKSQETVQLEPHLLMLHFENCKSVAIANFYFEKDFVPRSPLGDDVWIIHQRDQISKAIREMSFERLLSVEESGVKVGN